MTQVVGHDLGDLLVGDRIADAPASHRIRLGHAVYNNRSVLDIFTEEYRTDVATIDVGYHHVNSLPVDIAIDDMFEKSRLARVEEGEVDRVVEMSEYVDVVKSELQIYGVSEL